MNILINATFHTHRHNAQQRNQSIIFNFLSIPVLKNGSHIRLFPVDWKHGLWKRKVEQFTKRCFQFRNAVFSSLGLIKSGPEALLMFNNLRTSSTSDTVIVILLKEWCDWTRSGTELFDSSSTVCKTRKLSNSSAKAYAASRLFYARNLPT
jgi:hypothetical protein